MRGLNSEATLKKFEFKKVSIHLENRYLLYLESKNLKINCKTNDLSI